MQTTHLQPSAAPGRRLLDWSQANLFANRRQAALTLGTFATLALVIIFLLGIDFFALDFSVVEVNRRLLFVGRLPQGEEWRLWPPLWSAFLLAGFSFGFWAHLSRRDLLWLGSAIVFVLALLAHGENGGLFAGAVIAAALAYGVGKVVRRTPRARRRGTLLLIVGWAALIPFTILIIVAFGGVKPALWGGLMLNVMLAAIGITVGLPLGILLALARASSLPALKAVATAIIEITRGGPLLAWLFIARFVMPEFLPDALNTDVIVNAVIILCLFTGAYVAEIVRGGLQSVSTGQVEAAQALGLGTVNITVFIVLPQALRAVIPALVSQLISLWKDTTLFSILSFTDAFGGAQAAIAQAEFIGRQKEVLIFIALAFWSVSFGMSRLSQRLERALGVGVR
jgi:general L-amino acid transport system permease protein